MLENALYVEKEAYLKNVKTGVRKGNGQILFILLYLLISIISRFNSAHNKKVQGILSIILPIRFVFL